MDISSIFRDSKLPTTEEELQLVRDYQRGDEDAGNRFISNRMPWILSVCKGMEFPSWVDCELVAYDCSSDIAISIKNYDPEKGSISTFLYTIIMRRGRSAALEQAQQFSETIDGSLLIEPEIPDPSETIAVIRHLFDDVELNEETQLVFDRMLKGTKEADIGRQLGWAPRRVRKKVEAIRREIAYRLSMSGKSASPWISDKELQSLAAEHQMQQGWLD